MPNQPLFQLFQQTIHGSHQLSRKKQRYSSVENNIPYSFISPSRRCYGFKLEYTNTCLFEGHPPPGIKKMCDAILIVHHKQVDYIILVEIKSLHKGQYEKQLVNGKYFCEWIINLLKEHEHYTNNPQYLGLLICQVNPSQAVKLSTTQNHNNFIEKSKENCRFRMFESHDQSVYLHQLITAYGKKPPHPTPPR